MHKLINLRNYYKISLCTERKPWNAFTCISEAFVLASWDKNHSTNGIIKEFWKILYVSISEIWCLKHQLYLFVGLFYLIGYFYRYLCGLKNLLLKYFHRLRKFRFHNILPKIRFKIVWKGKNVKSPAGFKLLHTDS